jgi:hypothetical protein
MEEEEHILKSTPTRRGAPDRVAHSVGNGVEVEDAGGLVGQSKTRRWLPGDIHARGDMPA